MTGVGKGLGNTVGDGLAGLGSTVGGPVGGVVGNVGKGANNEGSRSRGGWIALKRLKRLKMRTGSRRRLKEMLGKMSYTTLY